MNIQNKQQLKETFCQTPIIDYMRKELMPYDQILAILLQGSSLNGTDQKNSDIDIEVLTLYTNKYRANYSAIFNGRIVHWWFTSIYGDLYGPRDNTPALPFYWTGLYNFKFLSKEDFIYINPQYLEIQSFVLDHKNLYSQIGLNCLVEYNYDWIHTQLSINGYIYKWNWIWIDYYYSCNHLERDDKCFEYINIIKRQRHIPENNNDLKNIINQGFSYAKQNIIQFESSWVQLNVQLHQLLDKKAST